MDYYKRLIIKIMERSLVGNDDFILKKLKQGRDLNQEEMRYLEELLDNIL
ncbi:hypothetical protein QQA45_02290 [Sneathia sanguinegens]|uniref:FAD assembly factor SdhE n=1 Tax=Sneathia sanguinegens TaxID=40543 RepID=A0ABT7HL44_9FUSO|nr:hypothetical protein [Sneathia sanguinegens]MDK9580350.1 hypothetical protein [Sneathia sanguinegens]